MSPGVVTFDVVIAVDSASGGSDTEVVIDFADVDSSC